MRFDVLPILFLVVIVLLGGVIAVIADNLGRKFGKKKHTLWGLRPRHTATLMTTLAGMGVSLFTILVVLAVSEPVRKWVTEGRLAAEQRDRAIAENQAAQRDLKLTRGQLVDAQNDAGNARKAAEEAQRKAREQAQRVAQLSARLVSGQERVRELDRTLQTRQLAIGDLTSRLTAVRRQTTTLRGQVSENLRRIAANNRTIQRNEVAIRKGEDALKKLRVKSARERKDLDVRRQTAINQNKELSDQNLALSQQNGELEKTRDQLERTQRSLDQQLKASLRELEDAQEELSKVQAKQRETEIAVAQAISIKEGLESTFDRVRRNRPTYAIGDEVARVSVPARSSASAARAAIERLFQDARDNAERKGAQGTSRFPAAVLLDVPDGPTASQAIDNAARAATGQSEPTLVVAHSVLNAFAQEPVSLVLRVQPNPVVFREGQTIDTITLDGSRRNRELVADVNAWLSGSLRNRAEAAGMRPQGDLGVVSQDALLDLLDEVREVRGPVRVEAQAEVAAAAADPLRLRFVVARRPPSPSAR